MAAVACCFFCCSMSREPWECLGWFGSAKGPIQFIAHRAVWWGGACEWDLSRLLSARPGVWRCSQVELGFLNHRHVPRL